MPCSKSAVRTANSSPNFYRPELDVLRFCAFLLVFVYHGFPLHAAEYVAWGIPDTVAPLFAAAARAGGLGVDLFFTLSAYLITELLLREQRSRGAFDIPAFYLRRILRIWPLYYFALLVVLPLLSFVLPDEKMSGIFWAAFLFFAGNWACAWWSLYPTSFALLWSVSVEEQFYLTWPWLLRWCGSRLPNCLIGMIAVATGARVFLLQHHASFAAIWTNTLARLDPIAGGALLAWLLEGRIPRLSTATRLLAIAGGLACLWIAGSALTEPGWVWLGTFPLAATACVAILLGSFAPDGSRAPGILTYLGKISYALYVFHVAAIRLVQNIVQSGPMVLLLAFLLTVALAALSYRYLESPFLRWKARWARVSTRPV